MTKAYQSSGNCKLELKFAQQSGVPILPVKMEDTFTASGWLGILTAGSICPVLSFEFECFTRGCYRIGSHTCWLETNITWSL
jgi:hypothetical protein